MILRHANLGDVPSIAGLMERSMEGLGTDYYDPDQNRLATSYLTNPDLDLIRDGTFFLVELDGKLVGCGGWSCRRKLFTGSVDQESLSELFLDPLKEPAKIRAFFIHPAHARQGIGRMIYDACEAAAAAKGFAGFELMATLPGVPFYERLGFTADGKVEIDLPNGSRLPCLKMKKPIYSVG